MIALERAQLEGCLFILANFSPSSSKKPTATGPRLAKLVALTSCFTKAAKIRIYSQEVGLIKAMKDMGNMRDNGEWFQLDSKSKLLSIIVLITKLKINTEQSCVILSLYFPKSEVGI